MWSIVSPALFNTYIRSVIESLIKSNLACHALGVYVGSLVYADDIILMSASGSSTKDVGFLQRKGDTSNQWERAKLPLSPNAHPLADSHQILHR